MKLAYMSKTKAKDCLRNLDVKANQLIPLWIEAMNQKDIFNSIQLRSKFSAIEDVVKDLDEEYYISNFSPFEARLWGFCPGDTIRKSEYQVGLIKKYDDIIRLLNNQKEDAS